MNLPCLVLPYHRSPSRWNTLLSVLTQTMPFTGGTCATVSVPVAVVFAASVVLVATAGAAGPARNAEDERPWLASRREGQSGGVRRRVKRPTRQPLQKGACLSGCLPDSCIELRVQHRGEVGHRHRRSAEDARHSLPEGQWLPAVARRPVREKKGVRRGGQGLQKGGRASRVTGPLSRGTPGRRPARG